MDNSPGRKALKQDIFLGIFITCFGALAFWSTLKFPSGAALMPRIVTILLTALGALLAVLSFVRYKSGKESAASPVEIIKLKYPVIAYLMVVFYVILINHLGFFSSTLLFLVCFMYFMNIKSVKTIALTVAILLGFVYLLFCVGLHVNFPSGILF